MRIKTLLLAWLLSVATVCTAEQTSSSGDAAAPGSSQGAETFFDIPYVPERLDRTIDPAQTLDIYRPKGAENPPVILYLHGGGWAFGDKKDVHVMPEYFVAKGIAFVSMNYRLRWDYKVYDQVSDVVSAIKWLAEHGEEHGLDGKTVVVMGNASGGHLASLAITDSSFMKAESFEGANVKAVVSLETISFDIPRLMKDMGSFVERRQHELIFTNNEKVWAAASPVNHLENSSTLKPFALLYSPDNETSLMQTKAFARKLTDAKVPVIMIAGAGGSEVTLDEQIGIEGSIATGALMAFLRSQL